MEQNTVSEVSETASTHTMKNVVALLVLSIMALSVAAVPTGRLLLSRLMTEF